MPIVELDASQWKTPVDFLTALRAAVGAPDGHGMSIDAFVDSIIIGGMNGRAPPYTIRVIHSETVPPEVRDYIALLARALQEVRDDQRRSRGIDTEVSLEIAAP